MAEGNVRKAGTGIQGDKREDILVSNSENHILIPRLASRQIHPISLRYPSNIAAELASRMMVSVMSDEPPIIPMATPVADVAAVRARIALL